MRVLVVDDHVANRLLPLHLLRKAGVDAVEVPSGEAALDLIARDPLIDHVLLDISMPGLSGTDVCRQLRQSPRGSALRIVAYTAHAFPSERDQIMAAGFDDLLIKPITRERLLHVLKL